MVDREFAEALDNTREAILGYLEAAAKEGISMPTTDSEQVRP